MESKRPNFEVSVKPTSEKEATGGFGYVGNRLAWVRQIGVPRTMLPRTGVSRAVLLGR